MYNKLNKKILFFTSSTCNPCKIMKRQLDVYPIDDILTIIDVYSNDMENYNEFTIESVPTVLLMKNDEIIDIIHGIKSNKELNETLTIYLGD